MISLSVEEILQIHQLMIKRFGGHEGILNIGHIESIVERLNTSIYGFDPFDTLIKKASYLYQSILIYHPFVDGHKRTGMYSTIAFFIKNDYIWDPHDKKEEIDFAIKTAEGKHDLNDISQHIKEKLLKLNKQNFISQAEKIHFTCPRCENKHVKPTDSYCHICGAILEKFTLELYFIAIGIIKKLIYTDEDFNREPLWKEIPRKRPKGLYP